MLTSVQFNKLPYLEICRYRVLSCAGIFTAVLLVFGRFAASWPVHNATDARGFCAVIFIILGDVNVNGVRIKEYNMNFIFFIYII